MIISLRLHLLVIHSKDWYPFIIEMSWNYINTVSTISDLKLLKETWLMIHGKMHGKNVIFVLLISISLEGWKPMKKITRNTYEEDYKRQAINWTRRLTQTRIKKLWKSSRLSIKRQLKNFTICIKWILNFLTTTCTCFNSQKLRKSFHSE